MAERFSSKDWKKLASTSFCPPPAALLAGAVDAVLADMAVAVDVVSAVVKSAEGRAELANAFSTFGMRKLDADDIGPRTEAVVTGGGTAEERFMLPAFSCAAASGLAANADRGSFSRSLRSRSK